MIGLRVRTGAVSSSRNQAKLASNRRFLRYGTHRISPVFLTRWRVPLNRRSCSLVYRLTCLLALLAAVGCQTTAPAEKLAGAVREYRGGHYALAHRQATELMDRASGGLRFEAAYLGGLSAYRLGDLDEAQRQLVIAIGSTDPATAGKAQAMLGLVRAAQDRPLEAAALLRAASEALEGEDARQAARHAALAYQQAGRAAAADTWFRIAAALAAPSRASAPPATAGFALQVGAFRERARAQQAAEDAAGLAERHGHGPVRIETGRDQRGRRLYLVRFGRFATRTAAANARSELGRLGYIVVRSTASAG